MEKEQKINNLKIEIFDILRKIEELQYEIEILVKTKNEKVQELLKLEKG